MWSIRAQDRTRALWLLAPHQLEEFQTKFYERAPLHISRNDPDYFRQYFSLQEFERIICGCVLRSTDVTVGKDGVMARPETYLYPKSKKQRDRKSSSADVIDPDRLSALLASGCSLVLDAASKFSPSLAGLCHDLELYFRFQVSPNVYFTPARAQGFAVHYDTHDTLIVQISGSKRWQVYNSPVSLPLEDQLFDRRVHQVDEPQMEIEMRPGDVLYVPRGYLHEARSQDEVSLHVTLGMYPPRWLQVLQETLDAAACDEVVLRKTCDGEDDAVIASLLSNVFSREALARTRTAIAARFEGDRRNSLDGQIAQMVHLDRLSEDSIVTIRPSVLYRLEQHERGTHLTFSGKTLVFGPDAAPLIRELSGSRWLPVHHLMRHDKSALKIVRRLIQEGFALQVIDAAALGTGAA